MGFRPLAFEHGITGNRRRVPCIAVALALVALLGLAAIPLGASAETQKITAIVNDEVISIYDLQQRLKLVISSSGLQPSEEVLRRIQPQVLRTLIEERLQIQEATKQKVSIDEKEVDAALTNIARQNNMSAKDIVSFLGKGDIDVSTLKDQLRANLAWSKLVSQRFGSRIYVSDEDIKAESQRISQSISQPQFLVGEIVLRIDQPDQEEEVHKTAERLLEQLHGGAPFQAVAQQFSQSSTAANGGDLGWVERSQLAPEIASALNSLPIGQVSQPIRTAGAYHIVFLRNKREAGKMRPVMTAEPEQQQAAAGAPIKRVQLKQILAPLPQKPTEAQAKAALAEAEAARAKLQGCGNAQEAVSGNKALKLINLPLMPFDQIAPFFQHLVIATPEGQASQPVQSPMGVHVIIVCKKEMGEAPPKQAQAAPPPRPATEPEPGLPGREEIEGRLYNQQLSMMSRRYLRDLRRDAVVELR